MLELSNQEAKMLALEGVGMRNTHANPQNVIDRLGLLQIDSVNVFERAHYLPLFSRIGNFDKVAFDELHSPTANQPAQLIEYWAHEASFIPIENLPLYKWRMDAARDGSRSSSWREWATSNRHLCDNLLAEIKADGPLTVSQVQRTSNERTGAWWGWSDAKTALEWLFMTGELVSAGRDKFSRRYGLPKQVLPPKVSKQLEVQDNHQAIKQLLVQAANTLAVATTKDLLDYHRMRLSTVKTQLTELVEAGELIETKVDGWKDLAYMTPQVQRALTTSSGQTNPTTILSPFDPVVWNRDRALRMFNFDYRIEIYTPKDKRIFGYYTLPILHNRNLVGRIDLKSDRQNSCLIAQATWAETWLDDKQKQSAAKALAKTLKEAQKWQKLDHIRVEPLGNLSAELSSAIG